MGALSLKTYPTLLNDAFFPLDQQILALLEIGNYSQAEFALKQALEINPDDFKTLYFLGYSTLNQQRYAEAIDYFKRVAAIQPKFADSYGAIGNSYSALGYIVDAEIYFRKAIRRAPKHPLYHSNLGDVLFKQGKIGEAKTVLLRAISLNPQDANAHYNLAVVCSMLGDQEKKVEHAMQALNLNPLHGRAFYLLCLDKGSVPNHLTCSLMERQLWDNMIPAEERMFMYFGLAHVYEHAGDYDSAFSYFSQGNQFKRKTISFDSAKYAVHASSICNEFREIRVAEPSSKKKTITPVFIVGMPRSGTTLVEQILHQHHAIHGAGEQLFIEQIIALYEQKCGISYPEFMKHISVEELLELGAIYLSHLSQTTGKRASFIIDKLPGNFMHIGFIKAILPHAKFIYCTRDDLDTSLSIFRQHFTGNIPYAYDLKEIGAASAVCQNSMQVWKALFGETSILDVAYEDLIQDTEAEAKRMLQFLGLEWEKRCLEFYKDWRLVKTASYHQVRRPIYRSSAGMHRHYEKHLAPAKEAFHRFLQK